MVFRFDKLYYSFDEHEIMHLYFLSGENDEYVYFNGTGFYLKNGLKKEGLSEYKLSAMLTPENRIIREIRQNEMFESFVLLGGDYVLHTFTHGDNVSPKGFVYTFQLYAPTDAHYQNELKEEFNSSSVIGIE